MSDYDLYYASSICWPESEGDDSIINHTSLHWIKSVWIEVPSVLSSDEAYEYINTAIKESTDVKPWYFNIDKV